MSLGPFEAFRLGDYVVRIQPAQTSRWIIAYDRPDFVLYWSMRIDKDGLADYDIWTSIPFAAKTFLNRDEAIVELTAIVARVEKLSKWWGVNQPVRYADDTMV